VNEWENLHAAVEAVNRAEIAEVEQTHWIKFLDLGGPLFEFHHVAVRGLFVGHDGRHWIDVALWSESTRWLPDTHRACADEWALDMVGGSDIGVDLFVVTLQRGQHMACLAPLEEFADLVDLGPVRTLPWTSWARSWSTDPTSSDGKAQAWAEIVPDPPLFGGPVAQPARRPLSLVRSSPEGER
jgi:hypothetical protein